ncbi:endonuclease V [Candidatus Latescibacterota bacterium]
MTCPIHSFDVSLEEAKAIQQSLREQVNLNDTIPNNAIRVVGGVDIAFLQKENFPDIVPQNESINGDVTSDIGREGGTGWKPDVTALAVVVTVDITDGAILDTVYATAPVYFPYIPGFLSFREGPAVIAALDKLKDRPDAMMYDGCGIAHPRGFGLASHMAVLNGVPSVGCAKSRLCGACGEPGGRKGDWTRLIYKNKPVGVCLRTRDNVRPLYVSPGSGFSIDSARELVMDSVNKYRLPEPTRLAHKFVTAKKKELKETVNMEWGRLKSDD